MSPVCRDRYKEAERLTACHFSFRVLQKELTQTLSLHPSYFTPALPQYLQTLLHQTVEGSCSGRLGYIIAVIDTVSVGRGKIVDQGAEFKITYKAIVYRPFNGEVVDGEVKSVNKVCRCRSLPASTR